jgi:hypothetical protein
MPQRYPVFVENAVPKTGYSGIVTGWAKGQTEDSERESVGLRDTEKEKS